MTGLLLIVCEKFALSLLLTLLVESCAAGLWEIREKKAWKVFLLTNLLTNPAAVMICWGFQLLLPNLPSAVYQLPVECIVVAAEAYIYQSFNRAWREEHEYGELFRKPFWFSVFANTLSYSSGCIIMLGRGGFS